MAATRQYRRQSNGRFAGSGGGTVTTTGRSGGFASAAHRANVKQRVATRAYRKALVKRGVKIAATAGATAVAVGVVSKAAGKSSPAGDIANMRTQVLNPGKGKMFKH